MCNVIFPNSVILFKVKNIMSQGQVWLKRKSFQNLSLVLTKRGSPWGGKKNAFFIITVKDMVYYIIYYPENKKPLFKF